jgi:phage shock protein A
MSSINRHIATLFKTKADKASDSAEDPREILDLTYQRQAELLREVRRGVAVVTASRNRVATQTAQLGEWAKRLEEHAEHALSTGREDLARDALARRANTLAQIPDLEAEEASLKADEDRLAASAQRMQANVERFRVRKEQLMANYTAAEAQTAVGEVLTGISEEMHDVGEAAWRARDTAEQIHAHAAAAKQLIESRVLEDVSGSVGPEDLRVGVGATRDSSEIDRELALMKARLLAVPGVDPMSGATPGPDSGTGPDTRDEVRRATEAPKAE